MVMAGAWIGLRLARETRAGNSVQIHSARNRVHRYITIMKTLYCLFLGLMVTACSNRPEQAVDFTNVQFQDTHGQPFIEFRRDSTVYSWSHNQGWTEFSKWHSSADSIFFVLTDDVESWEYKVQLGDSMGRSYLELELGGSHYLSTTPLTSDEIAERTRRPFR